MNTLPRSRRRPVVASAGALLAVTAFFLSATVALAAASDEGEDESEFVSLFNGKNLDGWQLRRAERKGYVVEDGLLVCPRGGGGYLFTAREYDDFVLRFEFRMEEGANSGIAIRCPLLDKKPAYEGTEIQILDNPRYAGKLRPAQYHGSIYDVAPAKVGALKPIGEWNEQEIVCDARRITVRVNGEVVVDANLDSIQAPAVLQKHPGLQRATGVLDRWIEETNDQGRCLEPPELVQRWIGVMYDRWGGPPGVLRPPYVYGEPYWPLSEASSPR